MAQEPHYSKGDFPSSSSLHPPDSTQQQQEIQSDSSQLQPQIPNKDEENVHADVVLESMGSPHHPDHGRSAVCRDTAEDHKDGEEMKKNGEETKKIPETGGPSSNPGTGKSISLSKLNAKAPEFIPRGPITPLQPPTTHPVHASPGLPHHSLQPQQQHTPHRSQALPRLMMPQSPRSALYSVASGGSPRMAAQFPATPPQMGQASLAVPRAHTHSSSGLGLESYGESETSDADNTGASTSSSKGVLTDDLRQKIVKQVVPKT
eukprot:Gb_06856 [translate_table: standard]